MKWEIDDGQATIILHKITAVTGGCFGISYGP